MPVPGLDEFGLVRSYVIQSDGVPGLRMVCEQGP